MAVLALTIVIPRLTGSTPYTVLTGSMVPTYPPGTLIVVKPEDPAALLAAVRSRGLAADARARRGAAGERHARERLSASASLDQLTDVVLRALVAKPGTDGGSLAS